MPLFDPIRLGASQPSGYEIQRSVRLNHNDSAYFLRTSVGSPTNVKIWTMSIWLKRDALPNGFDMEILFGNDYVTSGISTRGFQFAVNHSNTMFDQLLEAFDGASGNLIGRSDGKYRDPTAWMHLVVRCDTTQGTQSNRMRIYINGVDIQFSNNLSQNQELTWNKGSREQYLGCHSVNGSVDRFYRGYMAEAHFIDGSSEDPSSFAETDSETGEYKPIKYIGTYGNNGWYLAFTDNSNTTATTLGKDYSGNGNNMTPSGFSVADGKNGDSFADTPTNNFCTLNSVNRGDDLQELVNGNLRRSGSSDKCLATFLLENNKYYFEYLPEDNNGNHLPGVTQHDTDMRTRNNNQAAFYAPNGEYKIEGGTQTGGQPTYASGDVIGVAIDTTLATPKIWFAKNNSWILSGDPSNGTNGQSLTAGKKYVFNADHGSSSSSTTGTCLFGAHKGGFTYDPPTGFVAACSKNLPTPAIFKGKEHVNTIAYTGNSTNRSISGFGFSPDWVWVKKREGGTNRSHQLFDTLRGAQQTLHSDGTGDSHSNGNRLSSFDSDGFSIGTSGGDDGINPSGADLVAWAWDAGSSTVTNTTGSISAQVRANATAGFSIIKYTGNGTQFATIGHGLGVKPKSFIIKEMSGGTTTNWRVYHEGLNDGSSPEDFNLQLNDTDAEDNRFDFADTAPSSSVITLGNHVSVNANNEEYICYVFSEVPGYSAFGKYVGNGGAGTGKDGAYIYLGFRPQWIMVKRASASENWCIWDDVRNSSNPTGSPSINENPNGRILRPDSNTNEGGNVTGSSGHAIDFMSQGFLCRTGESKINSNGSRYVYWAFASSPAKIARAA